MRKRRKELLLVKPVPQHTPRRPQPTDLYALRTPPLFAVEDGEGRPADLTLGGLAYGASFRCQSQLSFYFDQKVSLLTSNLAIRIRIPAGVKASRGSCEVHDWQSFTLEIAPVQAVAARFVVGVVVVGVGGLDLGDVPLYADEADCCVEVSLCYILSECNSAITHPPQYQSAASDPPPSTQARN